MELDLQKFAGTLTVTMYKDAGMTTASASPSSSLAKNDAVALTITPASGYELDEIEVIEGGVTPEFKNNAWGFKMGEDDVVLYVKSKGSAVYKVVENTFTCINGTVTNLVRNMKLVTGPNGAIVGVDCNGTSLSSLSADIIAALVASGAIIKI